MRSWRYLALVAAMLAASGSFFVTANAIVRLSALDWLGHYLHAFAIQFLVFLPMLAALARAARLRRPQRVRAMLATVLAGAVIGMGVIDGSVLLVFADVQLTFIDWLRTPVYLATLFGLMAAALELQVRGDEAAQALHEHSQREAQARRDAAAMRAQALAAQAEPHFLFNTLANLRRQYSLDAEAGDRLCGHLLTYLEAALPHMRRAQGTLGDELRLVMAYLALQQVRMAERLQVGLDVAPTLAAAALPPLTLLTLVENAIKHGLDPQPLGGAIAIAARAEAGRLRVSVADSGRGLAADGLMGSGTGLANIRERLRLAHGEQARLALRPNTPHGLVAELELPLASAEAGAA